MPGGGASGLFVLLRLLPLTEGWILCFRLWCRLLC